MPRYHLYVRDGVHLVPDEIGTEFETVAAAEREAARTAADIGSYKLPNSDACQTVVEVSDEHHRRIVIMTVSMQIDRPTPLPQALSPWAA